MTGKVSILDQGQGLLDFLTGQTANTREISEIHRLSVVTALLQVLRAQSVRSLKSLAILCDLGNALWDPGDFNTNNSISRKLGTQLPTVDK